MSTDSNHKSVHTNAGIQFGHHRSDQGAWPLEGGIWGMPINPLIELIEKKIVEQVHLFFSEVVKNMPCYWLSNSYGCAILFRAVLVLMLSWWCGCSKRWHRSRQITTRLWKHGCLRTNWEMEIIRRWVCSWCFLKDSFLAGLDCQISASFSLGTNNKCGNEQKKGSLHNWSFSSSFDQIFWP